MSDSHKDVLAMLERSVELGEITHLPVWTEFKPERIVDAVSLLLEQTESRFAELEAEHNQSWKGLMEPLEALQVRLGRLMGAVVHLLSVKYSDELQKAYDDVRPAYVELSNRMAQSRSVYQAMAALRDGDEWQNLEPARQRILAESIRGMERSGVHLEGEEKARYQEIRQRLSELSNTFQTNLVKEEKGSRIILEDAKRTGGIPEPILTLALNTARDDGVEDAGVESGPWHFVVNGVNFQAVIQQAEDRALREEFYRKFRARGSHGELDNRPVLEEMLRLRQEEAKLVGFDSYADLSIDAKMAPSTKAVWQLLGEIESAARPVALSEYDSLKAFMADAGAPDAGNPAPWDIAFWTEALRRKRYDYDSEALREFFQMPRVLEGLFSLIRKLYDVDIKAVAEGGVPVWDESVTFYEVRQHDAVIAGFFVDPYARSGEKRGGAWMNTVVGRSRTLASHGRSSSIPVALFVMNGRPPAEGRPALMSLDEVRTLFHEFGHATQHMFTDIEEGGASGMNLVEWDAVELASQFNEYWMEHKPFLKDMTRHWESGDTLDDETLDRVLGSKNFMIGGMTLRQLQFGKTDMALHQHYGVRESPARINRQETPFEIERRIADETLVVPTLEDETQLPAFGHLFSGGYAAGYYSYKWAEVLAADAFAAFREAGLENESAVRDVAQRFRETVLGLGGSLSASDVYRLFRGRDATADALLIDQGLKTAD